MNESIEAAKRIIDGCSKEEQLALKKYVRSLVPHAMETLWGLDADTILSAIERSSDLTKRGVRGIIAEAVFETSIGPSLRGTGWVLEMISADVPYDAILRNETSAVKLQIKLQRSEKKAAKFYYPRRYSNESLYVVEVQKTRSGMAKVKGQLEEGDSVITAVEDIKAKTRPYKFGDFDILAVNMHPSTKNWTSFRYTVGSWLIPRIDKTLIEVLQPVPLGESEVWTSDLVTCLGWLASGQRRTISSELLPIQATAKAAESEDQKA